MNATEQITVEKVRELINNLVDKAIKERHSDTFMDRFAVRSGIIESLLEILIANDPTAVAEKLYLIKFKHILMRFESETDLTGDVIQECTSKSICEEYLTYYKKLYPESIFKISQKIIEL